MATQTPRLLRVQNATEALRGLGYESIASFLDDLLGLDSIDQGDCCHMSIALLTHGERDGRLVQSNSFRRLLRRYTSQVVDEEMTSLVEHRALRFPAGSVSPEALEQFNLKAIAQHHNRIAPILTSVLRRAVGVTDPFNDSNFDEDPPEVAELGEEAERPARPLSRRRDKLLIATISLCMLSYARNMRSNILQIAMGYFAFANNSTKQMIEILHCLGMQVTYETIWQILQENADKTSALLQEKAWSRRSFVSFDNMNFQQNRRDQRMHNKAKQRAYTAGYVCFMRSDHDNVQDAVWDQTYIDADQVDHGGVNSLVVQDFLLDEDDRRHRTALVQYMLSRILAKYFPAATSTQKRYYPDGRMLPKYQVFQAPLREVQCPIEKSELLPLPVLDLDEASISGTIEILRTYLKRLGIENCVVGGKKVMFRGDFLTVRNITRAIYQSQMEIHPIDRFEFIKPIAGFLHLQMNILKLFLGATWGNLGDRISLARFQIALKQKNVTKTPKDFHVCDDFFRTIVIAFVVTLCMHGASCDRLPAFRTWLSKNNWRKLILAMSNLYIDLFKPGSLRAEARSEVKEEVVLAVATEEAEWINGRNQDRAVGITTTYMGRRDWKKEQTRRVEKAYAQRRDVIHENALVLLNLELLYLDFADACRGGYSARVEKCVRCFAVVFQGSSAKNYVGETLHLVACLKKLWKPEFKYVNVL